ncbi:lycopene cyclase family protein [Rhodococcus spongiicola]|uniref:Lycopene cyclase family protein n=1 Tax=Rhodococcus spongiicola TaxID=2487352 RepID=A0A438AXE0_9NOCA|nr:lycopene cyclase family protein [Rhodococcus spongiicola]RVW03359.1 lycopene cyclase family protein [Rhodococcus spongiicola]
MSLRADVAVVGLGPAGRALAHRSARAGLKVVGVDPNPDRPWASTYAAWVDELPGWLGSDVLRTTAPDPRVWAGCERIVDRPYCVLDNSALHRRLDLDGVRVIRGVATEISSGAAELRDGSEIRAARVVDARGLRPDPTLAEQTAFGLVLPAAAADPALGGASCWFMDWRRDNGTAPGDPPSFLYAVPLSDDTVLVEETCLVGRPGLPVNELRGRLDARLGNRGVDPAANLGVERVRFPVQAERSRSDGFAFGARAGLIHPATGYSVAASLGAVDDVVQALVSGQDPAKALWPWDARLVQSLREVGLAALLQLEPAHTAEFFDAFFALPIERQRAYLSRRTDAAGTMRTMWELFRTAARPIRRTLVRVGVRRSAALGFVAGK